MEQRDFEKELGQRQRTFNGLTAREWTLLSKNVWSDVSSARHKRHLDHGAVFPVKLADRLIRMYSKEDDLTLDPFAGIGSTCVAAFQANRRAIGIELNPKFFNVGRRWLDEIGATEDNEQRPTLINGDARNMLSWIAPDSVQITVTSPPYANFINRSVADRQKTHKKSLLALENNSKVKQYSEDPMDFGNLEYPSFIRECGKLLRSLLRVTRPGGYAAWIVKDYRLPPETPYIAMHADLARIGVRAGWKWQDLVVWDQNEQRSLVLLGYPSKFYTNQNCSFIVVFRKPG